MKGCCPPEMQELENEACMVAGRDGERRMEKVVMLEKLVEA